MAEAVQSSPIQQEVRRRGRPPKVRETSTSETAPESETITYMPGTEDPVSTKFFGHTFHANVPKIVTNAELIKKLREHPNPFFKLGQFNPETDHAPPEGFTGEPKTAEQYRAHAVTWIKKCKDIEDLAKTWVAEQRVREMCDFGTDDYAWLGTIFIPTMHELARKADMGRDDDLKKLWARYGVFALPF